MVSEDQPEAREGQAGRPGVPHTATVRAASNSTIYEFSDAASFLREQRKWSSLCARSPITTPPKLSETMVARLVRTTELNCEMPPLKLAFNGPHNERAALTRVG